MDLALDNLQRLICHKTKPNQTKPKESWRSEETCCHLDSNERSPAHAAVKNLKEVK